MKTHAHRLVKLYNNVAAFRSKVGFPQVALSERVGIHRSNLRRIETGQTIPSILLALQIAKYLDVPIQELFTLEEIKILTKQEKFLLYIKEMLQKNQQQTEEITS